MLIRWEFDPVDKIISPNRRDYKDMMITVAKKLFQREMILLFSEGLFSAWK